MAQIIPIRKRRDLFEIKESRVSPVPASTNAPGLPHQRDLNALH